MAKTPDEISAEIRSKLKDTAPGLSMALGTPERKIVDAVSESISEAYIDQYLVGSLLDIDTKTGLELEQTVGIFGFGRLQGRRATGVVRVEMTTAATDEIIVQKNTQFYTAASLPGSGETVYFVATESVVIPVGAFTADVPVECREPGTQGNLPPDSITFLGTILGAASVTNLTAMTGGVDVETDDELRQRFKNTLLRNVTGTHDFYLGLAYQNKFVSRAVCYGPVSKYATQIVTPTNTLSVTTVNDVKWVWPDGETAFVNLGQTEETFYRRSTDYTLSSGATSTPVFTRIATGQLVADEVIDLEFEYTTRSSRNNPAATPPVTNKVDIFVNGSDPYSVTERTVVSSATLTNTVSDVLYHKNFQRMGTSGTPQVGSRFTRLGSVPLVSFPPSIVVGTSVFTQGTHYHVLRGNPLTDTLTDTALMAGSPREVAGIEWVTNPPADNTPITVTYVYNRVPEVLNAVVKQARQVTTDVMVHEAQYSYMRIYVSVEYDRGYVVQQVNNSIQDRLRLFFSSFNFGDWLEISDMTLAIRQVMGVDNIKLTTSDEDAANYGIKVYDDANDPTPTNIFTDDFKLRDCQLPIFLEAVVKRKANR